MTIGHVGADGDALVPLPVRGPGGAEQEVEAVLDTGFNGYLALPPPVIEALRLERLGQETLVLASGERRYPRKYEAAVVFLGELRPVEVIEAGEELPGTRLLRGRELRIQYVEGGRVRLEALP